jgi:hypothetical protein
MDRLRHRFWVMESLDWSEPARPTLSAGSSPAENSALLIIEH